MPNHVLSRSENMIAVDKKIGEQKWPELWMKDHGEQFECRHNWELHRNMNKKSAFWFNFGHTASKSSTNKANRRQYFCVEEEVVVWNTWCRLKFFAVNESSHLGNYKPSETGNFFCFCNCLRCLFFRVVAFWCFSENVKILHLAGSLFLTRRIEIISPFLGREHKSGTAFAWSPLDVRVRTVPSRVWDALFCPKIIRHQSYTWVCLDF